MMTPTDLQKTLVAFSARCRRIGLSPIWDPIAAACEDLIRRMIDQERLLAEARRERDDYRIARDRLQDEIRGRPPIDPTPPPTKPNGKPYRRRRAP